MKAETLRILQSGLTEAPSCKDQKLQQFEDRRNFSENLVILNSEWNEYAVEPRNTLQIWTQVKSLRMQLTQWKALSTFYPPHNEFTFILRGGGEEKGGDRLN